MYGPTLRACTTPAAMHGPPPSPQGERDPNASLHPAEDYPRYPLPTQPLPTLQRPPPPRPGPLLPPLEGLRRRDGCHLTDGASAVWGRPTTRDPAARRQPAHGHMGFETHQALPAAEALAEEVHHPDEEIEDATSSPEVLPAPPTAATAVLDPGIALVAPPLVPADADAPRAEADHPDGVMEEAGSAPAAEPHSAGEGPPAHPCTTAAPPTLQ